MPEKQSKMQKFKGAVTGVLTRGTSFYSRNFQWDINNKETILVITFSIFSVGRNFFGRFLSRTPPQRDPETQSGQTTPRMETGKKCTIFTLYRIKICVSR
jgi:hypothetical protein